MLTHTTRSTDAPLSEVLRVRTAQAHAGAEHSPFMTALVAGRVTGLGLAALLTRLAPVYDALERVAATWAGHPAVEPLLVPGLERSARLRADLEHLSGSADVPVTPAGVAYAARVEEVGRTSAPSFVAHHYTRYLGDLSGGQVIRAALERSLGLSDGHGTSFFSFPELRAGAVKRQYREHLDAAPFDVAERELLASEALVAYRHNVTLISELDADLARWTSA